MGRVWVLVVSTASLVAACALAEPLPPPGTVPVQLEVNNRSSRAVDLGVEMQGRMIPNSAQPPSLPPNTVRDVIFHVPLGANWNLRVGGEFAFEGSALGGRTGEIVNMGLEIDERGNLSWWCSGLC